MFTRTSHRLAGTIAAAGALVCVLAGCGSDPASVKTTPESLSGSAASSTAAATPPSAANASTGAAATANAPASASATDDGSAALTALANCLKSKGIPLDINQQPDPSNPKYDASAAEKAFTSCSMSIIASQTPGN